jgi:geranylgeranyl reductase family protein
MLEYDIAIVGGGPIGGYIAGKIAEKNFRVAIFEKNKEIGLPLKCAGLVTPRVFDYIEINKKYVVQNEIKGANIHSPYGKILTIGGDRSHALVINRIMFDREIIQYSMNLGAEVFLNNSVLSAQREHGIIEIKTSEDLNAQCKILIGADGPYSKVRDIFAFPQPGEFLRGIGAEVTNADCNPDIVEIFVGDDIAPGFFAWIIPTNIDGTHARIGLCVSRDASRPLKYYFSNFCKNSYFSNLIKDVKIVRNIGGVIPLGALNKTSDSNVMLAGDAAAQVKPTSGGGIYTGLLCANHCANVAIEGLQRDDFSLQFLKKYHKLWSADIGRELDRGMKFRNFFRRLTDKQMDNYIEKFTNPKIIEIINKHGDIDYPSKLIKPLLKKIPFLIKLLPEIIKN